MASHRFIGYVGRLAVAVGVGAAAMAGGPGIASADTESNSSAVDAGPEKPASDPDTTAASDSDADASDAPDAPADEPDDADKPKAGHKPSLSTKLRQAAEQFETDQVERLRSALTPRKTKIDEPEPKRDNDSATAPTNEPTADVAPAARLVDEPADGPSAERVAAAAAAPVPWSADPFRPQDPEPDDMPAAVLGLRNLLMGAVGPEFRPYVREGVEAVYRGSQIVPWVNTVVPAYKIVPAFIEAARGNRSGAQVIINQLLLTTGPVSLLYYGYDEIADLANREAEARLLKEQFYATAWDTLDPMALLHVAGQHGLRG